ncbi:penicillin-binding protein activator LpoB [Arsenophonus symbiont of Ornithomya chloropus]|uniref:penicillin-binding protein activator LpoB n=1 Tax=Arsenophonus symbiont of Ornithomya chloropus TaxID=634121 RepID=UPI0032B23668
MTRFFQFIMIIFLLVGCSSLKLKKTPISVMKKFNKELENIENKNIIEGFLKEKKINWLQIIMPLTNELAKFSGFQFNKVLLINPIKNNTNLSIPLLQVRNIIIDLINNQNIFKLVPEYVLINTRKILGLSEEDSLITRSKAIGLARYLQADYVLYSVISGNKKNKKIEMQIMNTHTGEIFWSASNNYIE